MVVLIDYGIEPENVEKPNYYAKQVVCDVENGRNYYVDSNNA